jgi:hypothetical protein
MVASLITSDKELKIAVKTNGILIKNQLQVDFSDYCVSAITNHD